MSFHYVVLGAGRQGAALACDLAANSEAGRITLADADRRVAERAVARLRVLVSDRPVEWLATRCDVSDEDAVTALLRGAAACISAVPYRFNVALTDAAIAAGVSFCDLGGNTGVVREQLSRDAAARSAGVSVVPDCGLAPGLGNILAAHGVETMDEPAHVHVRCGGLPERPVGPLGYKLLFNFQGLINEYSGMAEFLRDGKKIEVPTLTELEAIEFAAPVGRCEAAVTSGGTSTCPDSFLGRLQSYDYKTVRYPGHFAIVKAMFGLGCFEESVRLDGGETLHPKRLLKQLMESRLMFPDVRDITVLRATVIGRHSGKDATWTYDLFDRHDEATGFTAMERTTAFPTALVAHVQARGLIAPGAAPLERCIPLDQYVDELPQHDINIKIAQR